MIVSVFVLESRQMGTFEFVNPKHDDKSVNARLDSPSLSLNFPVCWVEIFQDVTQNVSKAT